jgi:hypothetical protein
MRAIALYRRIGDEAWSKLREYGKRWSIETAYPTFKRLSREFSMAKTMENIAKELMVKAFIYNTLVNL